LRSILSYKQQALWDKFLLAFNLPQICTATNHQSQFSSIYRREWQPLCGIQFVGVRGSLAIAVHMGDSMVRA